MKTEEEIIELINERIKSREEEMREIHNDIGTNNAAYSMELGARDELVALKEEIGEER